MDLRLNQTHLTPRAGNIGKIYQTWTYCHIDLFNIFSKKGPQIMPTHKSPLHQTVSTTKTDVWNDSCAIKELTYAIEHGAVGDILNPTIVYTVLKQELGLWKDRIQQLISENPTWSEVEITWKIFEEIGLKGAELLLPVFERECGKKGRLSIQTNPANYRDAKAVAEQAIYFDLLAPNIQVKAPVTQAGVKAIEEATYQGVNINVMVC